MLTINRDGPETSFIFEKISSMDLIHPRVQDYAEKYSSHEDPILKIIADFTRDTHPESHMISGHLQGKLLQMVSHMIRPRRVLEIGTFTGYSALCLAQGLTEDGRLHTIELREEEARTARQFFDQSESGSKIILHTGSALEIIPTLTETWDLVFIDADKPGYIDYFNLVLPKLKKNGFILADNIFFHGQILDENPKGKSAKAIIAFNESMKQRSDVDKVILTIRDGLYLIRKL